MLSCAACDTTLARAGEAGPGREQLDNQGFGKGRFPDRTPFFPSGYKALGDYLHERQLQFGICKDTKSAIAFSPTL